MRSRILYVNHPEYRVLGVVDAYQHLKEEFQEFLQEPSWDEFSDCCYAINRLAGALLRRKYLRIIPFDGIHISKCNRRFLEYGHFRSKRHINL